MLVYKLISGKLDMKVSLMRPLACDIILRLSTYTGETWTKKQEKKVRQPQATSESTWLLPQPHDQTSYIKKGPFATSR